MGAKITKMTSMIMTTKVYIYNNDDDSNADDGNGNMDNTFIAIKLKIMTMITPHILQYKN